MKSLAELAAIRDKVKPSVTLRENTNDDNNIRVVVGMATCGIAAGARPVLSAFVEEVAKRKLNNVTIVQTGCMGMCKLEPMVEVFEPGKDKVTYIKVTPEMAAKIVSDHFVNGKVVKEYSISTQENL